VPKAAAVEGAKVAEATSSAMTKKRGQPGVS